MKENILLLYNEFKTMPKGMFIDEYLNKDLFNSIYPYEYLNRENIDDTEKNLHKKEFEKFKKKYGFKYFEELLERYSEREVIKDIKDFRTLVFVAIGILNSNIRYYEEDLIYRTYSNTVDQVINFLNNAIDKMISEFDYITAATILFTPQLFKLRNKEVLFEKILEEVTTNKLDFNNTIYGLCACYTAFLYSSKIVRNKPLHDIDNNILLKYVESNFFELLCFIKPSENVSLNDYPIYKMASYLCFETAYDTKRSEFPDKETYKYIRSLIYLQERVIGIDVNIRNIEEALKLDKYTIMFFNYMAIRYTYFNAIMNKKPSSSYITKNKLMKLKIDLWQYLSFNTKCPKVVLKELLEDIEDQSYKETGYYGYSKEPYNVSTKIAGNVSKTNFDIVLKIQDKIHMDREGWIEYFIRNKDLFALLNDAKKEEFAMNIITMSNEDDKNKFNNLLNELGFNKRNIDSKNLTIEFISIETDFDLLKHFAEEDHRKLILCIRRIKEVVSVYEYLKYLIECLENKHCLEEIYFERSTYSRFTYREYIVNEIKDIDINTINDNEIKKKVLRIKDKAILLCLDNETTDIYNYIFNNLQDATYLELMNITKDGRLKILYRLKNSLEKIYSSDNKDIELLNNIETFICKVENDKELNIDECRDFIQELGSTKDLTVNQKAKIDNTVKSLINNENTELEDIKNILLKIKEKNNSGVISDTDLLQIMKNGLLQIIK